MTTKSQRNAFGRAISAARVQAGQTQDELGRRANLGQTAISRIESGTRRIEVLEFLSIADALGVDATVLLDRGRGVPGEQGPDYVVIGLRLAEEHPGHASALRPAVRLLERLAYLQERVHVAGPGDQHWNQM